MKRFFVLENSVDHVDMNNAALHLGLHCVPKMHLGLTCIHTVIGLTDQHKFDFKQTTQFLNKK